MNDVGVAAIHARAKPGIKRVAILDSGMVRGGREGERE